MPRVDEIRANLATVEARVAAACERAGRARDEVLLIAVTKTFPATDVEAVVAAGVAHVGENKVQEAREKKPLVDASAAWHLIGHLQSNKVKDAVRLFDVIQTVDSIELAEKIARVAETAGKRQEVLLQVNVGGEQQKSGASPDETPRLVRHISTLPSLRLTGLMTIPPAGDAEAMRPYFGDLRSLRDVLGLRHLSMGMTDDFEVAIEEGATIIRVGRAVFGSRTAPGSSLT